MSYELPAQRTHYIPCDELTRYLIVNYPALLTPHEKTARARLLRLCKAEAYGPDWLVKFPMSLALQDPAVTALLRDGADVFHERIKDRLLAEHADQIVFNRCAKCGTLGRTPKACLCPNPACNHTWYETRDA